jgi:hypothetical protein
MRAGDGETFPIGMSIISKNIIIRVNHQNNAQKHDLV